MAESGRGHVPEEVEVPDQPAPEADASVQEQARDEVEIPVETASTRRVSRGMRWLALLLIIAVLPLGWFLLPEHTRQKWMGALTNRISPKKISDTDVASAIHAQAGLSSPEVPKVAPAALVAPKKARSEPAESETSKASSPPDVPVQVPVSVVVAPHPSPVSHERKELPAMTSEEAKALMATMGKLQDDMRTLQDQQEELSRELHNRQQLELRTRLRWITDTGALLPQMVVFWQDIELLPLLSESERNEARAMRKMAASDADKLDAWSTRLKRLAATLPVPEHQDIIPKPEQPAFSWFTGKFHLRPAPTPEQRKLSALRTRLLDAARMLSVELWPEPKAWRHLLADLREQFGDDTDLSLPEQLDGVRKDIAAMRAKAANWLGQL